MQQSSTGRKEEPIDVDDPFDGIEEIKVKGPGLFGLRQRRERRLAVRRIARVGSSSHQPIVLDSDEEDTTVARNRGLGGSSTAMSTDRGIRQAQGGPSSDVSREQSGPLSAQNMGKWVPTPMANLRLRGLVMPASSPSPNALTPASDPIASSSRQQFHSSVSGPSNVVVLENPVLKMDLDSSEPALSTLRPGDGYSSSEDLWEGDDGMAMDVDDDLDYFSDTAFEENETPKSTLSRLSPPPRTLVKSRVMPRAETSTLLIEPEGRHGKAKPLRIWDIHGSGYPSSLFAPLIADYRQLRPRSGILSRVSSSRSRNAFNCWLNIPSLRLSSPQFKKTSGSVNKIAQSHEFIAVASPTKGGGTDLDMSSGTPEIDPYNREGNLVVWGGQKNILLDGHSRSWPGEDGSLQRCSKFYTVNDVAFDPLRPNRLVSSGNDCAVHVVDLEICGDTFSPRNTLTLEYPHAPYDIAYKPNTSMFAVSCLDGNIHVHTDNDRFTLDVSNGRDSRPGTFIWGASSENGALSNMLFASSESDRDNVCTHTAYDVAEQCAKYELDINDSGDAMALDPQGRILALITSKGDAHALSLFDVAYGDGERCAGTRLHALHPHARHMHKDPLEVTHAAFSPDGILLALARTDNATHVYDVRFLGARPWAKLAHPIPERPRDAEYGVTGLRWVGGTARGSLGLLTGGADGCVRLWDVMRAPTHEDESMVVAEVDHDVACFSVGDPAKNERKLVVGDCGGEVYIFD